MNNEFLIHLEINLKDKQENDIARVDELEQLLKSLKDGIRDRARAITLLEAAVNPEMRNKTIVELLKC